MAPLWADLMGDDTSGLRLQTEVAKGLVPDEDDSWVDVRVCAALGRVSRLRDSLPAEWCRRRGGRAARQVYEALDLWVTNRDNVDLNADGAEERIVADPLMQVELGRKDAISKYCARRPTMAWA